MFRRVLIALLVSGLLGAAAAEISSAQTPAVTCESPVWTHSSHQALADRFGAQNVTFGPSAYDASVSVSIVHPDDPKRRLEVLWADNATRSRPAVFRIAGQSEWRAPLGLHIGATLETLERLNGKPLSIFLLNDSGNAVAFAKDGALGDLAGGCSLGINMRATAPVPQLDTSKEFLSSDAAMRAAGFQVTFIGVAVKANMR